MTEPDEDVAVRRAEGRYEIFVGGEQAGFTVFEPDSEGRLVFPHTVIDPAFGGRGLGGILVGEAMKDLAARGETVVPLCPFVTKYLRSHEVPALDVAWSNRPEGEDGEA